MKTKKDVPDIPVITEEEKEEGIQRFIEKAKDTRINRNVDGDIPIDIDGNVSGNNSSIIVINRPTKKEEVKRVSYYLKPSTIKKIEKLATRTDMKISPWLQKFLEENLDKIKIE